jgi:hypothetical protein
MNPSEASLPVRFHCGASYQWRNADGWLTVDRGALTFEFGGVAQRIGAVPTVRHKDETVTVVRARLLPPPLDRGIIVNDGAHAVLVATGWPQYARIRRAICAAGFEIKERLSWISRGEREARALTRLQAPG